MKLKIYSKKDGKLLFDEEVDLSGVGDVSLRNMVIATTVQEWCLNKGIDYRTVRFECGDLKVMPADR